jgi:hypothetical protein
MQVRGIVAIVRIIAIGHKHFGIRYNTDTKYANSYANRCGVKNVAKRSLAVSPFISRE